MRNMKSSKMRSGFTMIELIFVIVVLGILAAVAMPKFVNVQDDAKVSSEKSTIGAVRSAIGMLHGKAIIKNGNFAVKFTAPSATTKTLLVQVTDELYPVALSVTDEDGSVSKVLASDESIVGDGNTASKDNYNYTITNAKSDGTIDWESDTPGNGAATLAVVLDLEGRTDWTSDTLKVTKGEDNEETGVYESGDTEVTQLLEGPASSATGVQDDATINEFDVDSEGSWEYNSITGTIIYKEDVSI